MIVVGSVSSVAVLMMVLMLFVLYFRKGQKKLPPADVIPEVSRFDIIKMYTRLKDYMVSIILVLIGLLT